MNSDVYVLIEHPANATHIEMLSMRSTYIDTNGDENRIDSLSRDTPVITNKKYIQVSSLSFTTWKLKVHITES